MFLFGLMRFILKNNLRVTEVLIAFFVPELSRVFLFHCINVFAKCLATNYSGTIN